ncbi:hypothetical protein F5Y16DRAFT_412275 [Xylariaceae sp. FL0255]|nr:hypothetical protein F5Y16DRAFT_412275 [Xylariaceae sp. FL0255]
MSKHAWKIELIPWDHLSVNHVERMYDQRIACGWRADEVQSWVKDAKKGGRIFYWAVLAKDVGDREELLGGHIRENPKEAAPLRDTATEIRLIPRQPTGVEFTPIGHVALAIHSAEEDGELGLPSPGTVWVHQLFISSVLQGGGYGAATMAQVEAVATREPMNATTMALDTLAKVVETESGDISLQDAGVLVTSKEDWYSRLGYRTYKLGPGYNYPTENGKHIQLKVAYMRKDIG